MKVASRGIVSRASTDFWSDFRGRIHFRGFLRRTCFRGKHFSVRTSTDFVGLYGLGGGSTDLTEVVRTWRGSTDLIGVVRTL